MGAETLALRATEAIEVKPFNGMDLEDPSPIEAMIAKSQQGPEATDSIMDGLEAPEADPIKAVTSRYESSMLGRLRDTASERYNKLSKFAKKGCRVALGGLALGGVAEVAPASASTTQPGSYEVVGQTSGITPANFTSRYEFSVSGAKISEKALSRARFVANARSISRAKAERDIRAGKCDELTGEEAMAQGIRTQGYMGTGKGYHLENRDSIMCDSDGDGDYDYRANCGNGATGGRANIKKAMTNIWVNNKNKAQLGVKAVVEGGAYAYCSVNGASAMAWIKGRAVGKAYLKVKSMAKGRVTSEGVSSLKATSTIRGGASAYADLQGKAGVKCVGGETTFVVQPCPEGSYPEDIDNDGDLDCIKPKDGTQTPPPPAEAPGHNPAPSPEEPYPGGYQCYDDAGQPVTPNPDETCPPNSHGGPAKRSATPNKVLV